MLFFGGEGIIVEKMTHVVKDLAEEDADISKELLNGLSPYRNSNINRYGDYNRSSAIGLRDENFNT